MSSSLDAQRLQRLQQDKARFVQVLLKSLENANKIPSQTMVRIEVGPSVVFEGIPGQTPAVDKLDQNALTLLLNALKVPGYEQPVNPNAAYAQNLERGSVRITAHSMSPTYQNHATTASPHRTSPVVANFHRGSSVPDSSLRSKFNQWAEQRAFRREPALQVAETAEWLLRNFGQATPAGKAYHAEYYSVSYDVQAQQYVVGTDRGEELLRFKHDRAGLEILSSQLNDWDIQEFRGLSEKIKSGHSLSPATSPGERAKMMGTLSPRGDTPFEAPTSTQSQPFIYSSAQINLQLPRVCDYLLDHFGSQSVESTQFQSDYYAIVYDEGNRDYRIFDKSGNQMLRFQKDNFSDWAGAHVLQGSLTPDASHSFSGVMHVLATPAAVDRIHTAEDRVYFLGRLSPCGDEQAAKTQIATNLGNNLRHFMQLMGTNQFEGAAYHIRVNENMLSVEAKDPRGEILRIQNGVVFQSLSASDVNRLSAFSATLERDMEFHRNHPSKGGTMPYFDTHLAH